MRRDRDRPLRSQKPIMGKHRQASVGALYSGITNPHRDWIDRAVGADAHVAAIWSGNTDPHVIWENEIFNRSVGTVYDVSYRLNGDLPETAVQVDRQTGVMRVDGKPVRSPYVLTDSSVQLAGKVVAEDARKGVFLYRVAGPLRQTSRVSGLYPNDTWSGPTVTYTRLDCAGGSLTVRLQSDPSLFSKPQTVSSGGRRIQVAPTATRLFTVPLQRVGRTCVARFRVTPTAVPAVATKGVNPDARVLGIHFTAFDYSPAPAAYG